MANLLSTFLYLMVMSSVNTFSLILSFFLFLFLFFIQLYNLFFKIVHAGDLTKYSDPKEYHKTIEWIKSLPHKVKIVTAGNHDHILDERYGFITEKQHILTMFQQAGITYLEHEAFQLPSSLGGHHLFVSPYAPVHLGGAFMPLHGLESYWEAIPASTDILVTHTPPRGYLDQTRRKLHVGCPALTKKIQAIQPKVCVFGHIHESNGFTIDNNILFINACTSNFRYQANQLPIVFDL
ncbi:Metallo-dependent phosphatase-like protein [Halteromyces radiatus]|uniref:Metallo-dependent phosphatase-like protein n=1 Tax=Halteromyces radiatus TaxID=101107 RepID=UPI00221F964F|nr:Metallo-dependent phosphatase-like protein [Halteromyces radiatus]KAI8099787.1 Metallo-dependent phosphatase-like protein [Halteromyces radiatus]